MKEELNIEWIPTSEVVPYSRNPRKNDKAVDIVAKSIKEFGWKQPLVLDKNNVIIVGHTRLKSAEKLGLAQVPVVWADDLSPEKIKAYRIMDNRSNEYAEWDMELLKSEVAELKALNIPLDTTGLTELELADLTDEQVEEQPIPELTKPKYEVKIGDIWALGGHRLMCGDSTSPEHVNKLMNGQKAKLMVTDPPYGVEYNPKWRDEADKKGILGNRYPTRALGEVANDDKIDWRETYKLFDCDIIYNWHASWFTSKVQEALESCEYKIIASIIWVKPHFALSQGDYHWRHEPCWYAVKKGSQHNWQGSRTEDTVWEIAGMNAMGASHDKADERTGHGTQKPIECMKRPIRNNPEQGDLIVDPFGGSGSTLIACEQTLRLCDVMELDPNYCSVIIERWENLTGKKGVKL